MLVGLRRDGGLGVFGGALWGLLNFGLCAHGGGEGATGIAIPGLFWEEGDFVDVWRVVFEGGVPMRFLDSRSTEGCGGSRRLCRDEGHRIRTVGRQLHVLARLLILVTAHACDNVLPSLRRRCLAASSCPVRGRRRYFVRLIPRNHSARRWCFR